MAGADVLINGEQVMVVLKIHTKTIRRRKYFKRLLMGKSRIYKVREKRLKSKNKLFYIDLKFTY